MLLKEIHAIEKAGVKIHLGVTVGRDLSLDELRESHQAVYIASGNQKARKLGIPGESLPQVESGLSFLRRIGLNRDRFVPRRLVIVGGGSTAFDCARTARRLGAEEVTIVYRRTAAEMPAGAEEIMEAQEEGIRLETLASPLEILGERGAVVGIRLQRMQPGNFGKDGRRWVYPVENGEFVLPCDGVVAAIDQEMDDYFINAVEERVKTYLDVNRFTVKTRREGRVRRRRRQPPPRQRGHRGHRGRQARRRQHRPVSGRQGRTEQGRAHRHPHHPRRGGGGAPPLPVPYARARKALRQL